MTVKEIHELRVGETAVFSKTVSETDVYQYAGITGDFNPAHIDEEYAKGTLFKTRIAHGMLSAGFISTGIGMGLPGPGSIYLSQSLRFTAPVRIGDTVTTTVEVLELFIEKQRVRLRTWCVNQHGAVVLDGEAMVMPPKKRAQPAAKGDA